MDFKITVFLMLFLLINKSKSNLKASEIKNNKNKNFQNTNDSNTFKYSFIIFKYSNNEIDDESFKFYYKFLNDKNLNDEEVKLSIVNCKIKENLCKKLEINKFPSTMVLYNKLVYKNEEEKFILIDIDNFIFNEFTNYNEVKDEKYQKKFKKFFDNILKFLKKQEKNYVNCLIYCVFSLNILIFLKFFYNNYKNKNKKLIEKNTKKKIKIIRRTNSKKKVLKKRIKINKLNFD